MTLRLPMIINGMLFMGQYLIAQSMPLYAWKYKNSHLRMADPAAA